MIHIFKRLTRLLCWAIILASSVANLSAQSKPVSETIFTKTNLTALKALISSSELIGVAVDLEGEVSWVDAAQNQFVLQTGAGALAVKLGSPGLVEHVFQQRVRLTGRGMAGQGMLDEALAANDGLHVKTEKSGTVYLKTGRHPLRVEWFNARADYCFNMEYAGPGLVRQVVPDSALCRQGGNGNGLVQGLNYRCFEGSWDRLPPFQQLHPVKTGVVANFDLNVRSRNEEVALQFTGYLQIDREGSYTFWTTSDDGSRFFIESSPLRLQVLGPLQMPQPRAIRPGQPVEPEADYFWAVVEGVVTGIHADPDGALEMELCEGTNRMFLVANSRDFHPPGLFSQIRAKGLCRCTKLADGGGVAARLLLSGESQFEELARSATEAWPRVTTLAELRHMANGISRFTSPLALTGTVISACSPRGWFAFADKTGGVVVETDRFGDRIRPGQQVVLTGNGVLDGNRLILGHAALVDNNGLHAALEQSGAIFLSAGRHPLHVSWFNRLDVAELKIYYQGPGLSRRAIPSSALIHPEISTFGSGVKWVPGLNYRCYNGDWGNAPRVSNLDPVQAGTTTNFQILVANRKERVGLEFGGFLEVSRTGTYTFSMIADDGSLLFIDEQAPQVQVLSPQNVPRASPVFARQILSPEQNNRWSETEGTVSFVSKHAGSLFLDLNSVYGQMKVEVEDDTGDPPLLMLGARVRVQGFSQSALAPDGQSMMSALIVPGMKQVQLLEADPMQWDRYPLESIGSVVGKNFLSTDEILVHIQGEAQINQAAHRLVLDDESGKVEVETSQPLQTNITGLVEVIGELCHGDSGVILRCGIYRKLEDRKGEKKQLPILTTIQQIKQLTREQAARRYKVKIRGVVTLVRDHGCGVIIQDDTSAIDVWWLSYSTESLPSVGDYWEVEGETSVKFSPVIESLRAVRLGAGVEPEPLHPAWDQLLNGSLDTRFVEIQGIVTAADYDAVTLFTRAGKMKVLLSPIPTEPLQHFQNALVRIRGCFVPIRDEASQQVLVGQFRLANMALNVVRQAPSDLFEVGLKHVSELLLFDARADSLQQVKIAGQVMHEHNGEFFLTEGTNVIRVLSDAPNNLHVGDLVEAVGFSELGGVSPVLREAVLRRTGKAPLPAPLRVSAESLFERDYDGRFILVEARLVGTTGNHGEKVLELQVGSREFLARLESGLGELKNLTPGSWLQLAGIYSEQGAGRASGQGLTSFELLLNSPASVRVLEQAPWWTLQRALIFVGGLSLIICAALLWIVQLRRRVEVRSAQLSIEVRRREQFQKQNELAKERSRIAKDMHDQLGANVTRVGLLAELTKKNIDDPDKVISNAEKIFQTAFELGRGLDEIVWAVNPKNDLLDKFCDYMAVQAQELFQLTDVLCRVDLPPEMPDYPLSAEVRHNLFHATKEALNNVVRHANAREVWMRFKLEGAKFQISIIDDGKGFVYAPESPRNGVKNMKNRLEEVGGSFTIVTQPNRGTEVILAIDLSRKTEKSGGEN